MSKLFQTTALLIFLGCGHTPSYGNYKANLFNTYFNKQISILTPKLKQCLRGRQVNNQLILYLNVNRSGTLDNITILPLMPPAVQQCIGMHISGIRINNTNRKQYRIKKVITL